MQKQMGAILITYPSEHSIKEANSLADAAGYNIKEIITQKHITRSKYGIGSGKAEEVKDRVERLKPDVIIFDEVLKPSQLYNLAKLCRVEVIDRERLILQIFEQRASTAESRIQIKLAQLRYDMVRVREKVRLAKMGEQPGFYGMGKYDADVYLLDIKRRTSSLKRMLENEKKRRNLYRIQRHKVGLPTVSLAGYTSAGKTTLFNYLTGESKIVGKGMFTTLSTFTRAIEIDNYGNRVLVSDTVGFISKLPAYMIDAFKSTLEELAYSDLVVLVLDISEPAEEVARKLYSSAHVMNELGVPMTKVIYVLNKVDLTSIEDAFDKAGQLGILGSKRVLPVSSKTGFNTDQLKRLIDLFLFPIQNNYDDTGEQKAEQEEHGAEEK